MTRLIITSMLCGLSAAALAQPAEVPDPTLTPGVIASTDESEVCARSAGLTYTKRHRAWTHQWDTFAKYGLPYAPHDYEDDDRVPVCLGGGNADPRNHWPQPSDRLVADRWGYETKDIMDAGACRLVCQGKVSLQEAQGWFLAPDWRVTFCAYRKTADEHDPRCP